jgi:hypothetical protein
MVAATARYMSGAPFTIQDTNVDADRNGEFFDPLPAGTDSGTADDAMKDVEHKGYRLRLLGQRTLDLSADAFNVTDRPNFENPSGDRRAGSNFLCPTALRRQRVPAAGSGRRPLRVLALQMVPRAWCLVPGASC